MKNNGHLSFNAQMLNELREVVKDPKLSAKAIMGWGTEHAIRPEPGETVYYLPILKVSVWIKTPVTHAA